jgi:hypothetical protein
VLAYGFTENGQFEAKTDQNSVFLGRDPRIANRLSITFPYFNFYWFWRVSHFSQNPKVLAYGFTENGQFGAKTDQNSIFLGRDPRIANRLSIKVSYFNFYGFWKISHFCSKSKGVSLQFYQKLPVWGKTDRNSVFLGRDPHNANRLSIKVSYFNFYWFWKISHFCPKSMGVSLRFYRKLPVLGKNWSKLRISWSWPPYCESVMYNVPVFQFLLVLRNFTFFSKSKGVSLRFYRKWPVWGKNWSKLHIFGSWPPYRESVNYKSLIFQFLRVLKNFTFLLKIPRC